MVSTTTVALLGLMTVGTFVLGMLAFGDGDDGGDGPSQSADETLQQGVDDVTGINWLGGAKAAVMSVVVLPFVLFSPVLRALPKTWKLYHKLHQWSGYQMQRAASADTLANVLLSSGREDVRPAKWVEGGEDEKDMSGWKVKGLADKRFDTKPHGRTSNRFGKADLIHVLEDGTEQVDFAEPAIDNAFQLDRERYLFRDASVNLEMLQFKEPGDVQGGGAEAVADGGEWTQRVQDVSVERPGILQDTLVPVSSRGGFDGQVVSWNQVSNIKQENADQEALRQAKNAGWMAAKLDTIGKTDLFKWVLILGAIGAVLLFHAEIGAFIAGLTNGGGGAVGNAASSAGLGSVAPIGGV
jgi:hypothetical protein